MWQFHQILLELIVFRVGGVGSENSIKFWLIYIELRIDGLAIESSIRASFNTRQTRLSSTHPPLPFPPHPCLPTPFPYFYLFKESNLDTHHTTQQFFFVCSIFIRYLTSPTLVDTIFSLNFSLFILTQFIHSMQFFSSTLMQSHGLWPLVFFLFQPSVIQDGLSSVQNGSEGKSIEALALILLLIQTVLHPFWPLQLTDTQSVFFFSFSFFLFLFLIHSLSDLTEVLWLCFLTPIFFSILFSFSI